MWFGTISHKSWSRVRGFHFSAKIASLLTSTGNFLSGTSKGWDITIHYIIFRNSEMVGRRKQLSEKEIQNFIDNLNDSEIFSESITSSSDSGKYIFMNFYDFFMKFLLHSSEITYLFPNFVTQKLFHILV